MSNERDFISQFESLEVPLNEFSHGAHVRLAWAYLQDLPLLEAMIRFRDSLKKFADHHGKSGLYHETITFSFLILIHERIHTLDTPSMSWEEFSNLNQDLLREGKSLLIRLYKEETLASLKAKKIYVLPDRQI